MFYMSHNAKCFLYLCMYMIIKILSVALMLGFCLVSCALPVQLLTCVCVCLLKISKRWGRKDLTSPSLKKVFLLLQQLSQWNLTMRLIYDRIVMWNWQKSISDDFILQFKVWAGGALLSCD